jgi:hypothetical protein
MRFFAVILSIVIFQALGFSATINVPADYSTIQAAIDAAGSGDTINIAAGSYVEQLTISGKSLILQGAGVGSTNVLSPAVLSTTFLTSTANKCVVGVINGGELTLSDVTVDGQGNGNSNYRFSGIGFRNTGGSVTDCEVLNIQDTPFSGSQHGVGIYAYNDDGTDHDITLTNVLVDDYQKTAIALSGENVNALVTNCSTVGEGQTTMTAQNGIQLSYGATGTVDGCSVTGNCYTGGYWTATGILLYDAETVDVINCPNIGDDQTGCYYITTSGNFEGNTLTAGVNAHGDDGSYYGLGIDDLGEHSPQVSVFGDGAPDGGSRNPTAVTVSNCDFIADQTGHGLGIGCWAMQGDNLEATIVTCEITGWEWGIDVWDDGTAVPTVQVFACDIYDNTAYGITNSTTSVVIAQYNWWGHASGPYNPQWNPDGQGDEVTDLVWFWPWLESPDYLTVPWDHTTIQAAIDASPNPGTVIVAPGDYTEQLFIDGKTCSLIGAGKGVTNLYSPATLAVSFTTSADNKCIVGVINGGELMLHGMTIDGQGLGNSNYRFCGVGFRNTGGTITDCELINIQDTPFSGAQHGVAIYAFNDDGTDHDIAVTCCDLVDYQKTGMALSGANVVATVTDCIVAGFGSTDVTAQNGIQLGYGANGVIDGCTVTGNVYTGANWTASGILLYDAENVDVKNCPSIADNQTNCYYITTSGNYTNNTLTAGINAHGQDGNYWGLVCGEEGNDGDGIKTPRPSAFGDGVKSAPTRAQNTVTVSDSTFLADTTGEGYGVIAGGAYGTHSPCLVRRLGQALRDHQQLRHSGQRHARRRAERDHRDRQCRVELVGSSLRSQPCHQEPGRTGKRGERLRGLLSVQASRAAGTLHRVSSRSSR